MFEHRFRELIAETVPAAFAVASVAAFVPCPCPVFAGFSPAQQGYVTEVYRIAREMTEAQFRQTPRFRMPAFSAN